MAQNMDAIIKAFTEVTKRSAEELFRSGQLDEKERDNVLTRFQQMVQENKSTFTKHSDVIEKFQKTLSTMGGPSFNKKVMATWKKNLQTLQEQRKAHVMHQQQQQQQQQQPLLAQGGQPMQQSSSSGTMQLPSISHATMPPAVSQGGNNNSNNMMLTAANLQRQQQQMQLQHQQQQQRTMTQQHPPQQQQQQEQLYQQQPPQLQQIAPPPQQGYFPPNNMMQQPATAAGRQPQQLQQQPTNLYTPLPGFQPTAQAMVGGGATTPPLPMNMTASTAMKQQQHQQHMQQQQQQPQQRQASSAAASTAARPQQQQPSGQQAAAPASTAPAVESLDTLIERGSLEQDGYILQNRQVFAHSMDSQMMREEHELLHRVAAKTVIQQQQQSQQQVATVTAAAMTMQQDPPFQIAVMGNLFDPDTIEQLFQRRGVHAKQQQFLINKTTSTTTGAAVKQPALTLSLAAKHLLSEALQQHMKTIFSQSFQLAQSKCHRSVKRHYDNQAAYFNSTEAAGLIQPEIHYKQSALAWAPDARKILRQEQELQQLLVHRYQEIQRKMIQKEMLDKAQEKNITSSNAAASGSSSGAQTTTAGGSSATGETLGWRQVEDGALKDGRVTLQQASEIIFKGDVHLSGGYNSNPTNNYSANAAMQENTLFLAQVNNIVSPPPSSSTVSPNQCPLVIPRELRIRTEDVTEVLKEHYRCCSSKMKAVLRTSMLRNSSYQQPAAPPVVASATSQPSAAGYPVNTTHAAPMAGTGHSGGYHPPAPQGNNRRPMVPTGTR